MPSKGPTALFFAIKYKQLAIAKLLIDKGANVNAIAVTTDAKDRSRPIAQDASMIRGLVFKGIIMQSGSEPTQGIIQNPLDIAEGQADMKELLVKAGAKSHSKIYLYESFYPKPSINTFKSFKGKIDYGKEKKGNFR